MVGLATVAMICLDCADPGPAAAFWQAVLGWDKAYEDGDAVMLKGPPGSAALAFDRIEGYQPPAWPNPHGTKQFHLDLACDDLDQTQAKCVALGATVPSEQPNEERWRVLIDPAGHPFCLTLTKNWGGLLG